MNVLVVEAPTEAKVSFESFRFDTMINLYHGFESEGLNVSTTPLCQWSFQQFLPLSWTTLRDKYCQHPIAIMGVVVRARPGPLHSLLGVSARL